MKFLAESHNTGDPTPYLQAEGARTSELQQAGTVEMILLKADGSGAIILLHADASPNELSAASPR
ncbi:MAG TPA: hypothetical protein VGO86_11065 [Candidatus Dormibacteraeota bacterium]|jgi:hypothetical protein